MEQPVVISACVVDTHNLLIINGVQPKAFVVDHKTYWYRSSSKEEAHFLAAVLNAPCVDNAIKAYQTRGIYVGPRDIHRRPFEVCAIPQYDPNNPQHQQLTALSQAAQTVVAKLDLSEGGVVAVRKRAREATHIYIQQIDEIAGHMFGFIPTNSTQQEDESMEEEAI